MAASSVLTSAVVLLLITVFFLSRFPSLRPSSMAKVKRQKAATIARPIEQTSLGRDLAAALPGSVILPQDAARFHQLTSCYWAQQEAEALPECVIQPQIAEQLCTAVGIIKREHDAREVQASNANRSGLFAVRSGGHSPLPGAATLHGGVVIDLGCFHEATPSRDGTSTVIGAGAKWADVSKVLDSSGLAVVGGRNSQVGVGGLILGGGLSFYSPIYGLVCSNALSYEVVLASGTVVTASASTNSDLWRALKGGGNNFGIVTRFTVRSFPSSSVWSGFLYLAPSQATKVLAAFHDSVNKADPTITTTPDEHAAGPLACFTYLQKLGIQAVSVNLVHTKPPTKSKHWPEVWRNSGFHSMWRFWSTFKVRTLTSATDELASLNPPGQRQVFATTTFKNDAATLKAAHAVYIDAVAELRPRKVRGLSFTFVLQPLVEAWARKGDTNPLGLDEGSPSALIVAVFTVNWQMAQDDDFVKSKTRRATERIDEAATARGMGHRYRYMNYCAEWQRPFEGYGEENHRFLKETSRSYDPDGLFQRGCTGGFKLWYDE